MREKVERDAVVENKRSGISVFEAFPFLSFSFVCYLLLLLSAWQGKESGVERTGFLQGLWAIGGVRA